MLGAMDKQPGYRTSCTEVAELRLHACTMFDFIGWVRSEAVVSVSKKFRCNNRVHIRMTMAIKLLERVNTLPSIGSDVSLEDFSTKFLLWMSC